MNEYKNILLFGFVCSIWASSVESEFGLFCDPINFDFSDNILYLYERVSPAGRNLKWAYKQSVPTPKYAIGQ